MYWIGGNIPVMLVFYNNCIIFSKKDPPNLPIKYKKIKNKCLARGQVAASSKLGQLVASKGAAGGPTRHQRPMTRVSSLSVR